MWMVFGDTLRRDENFGKSAPFYFYLNMKKFLTLIFLSLISCNAIQAEITWKLSDDGTLTISGTDMPDYIYYSNSGNYSTPWNSRRDEIKKVVIDNGVTNIGENAFCLCPNLASITIPNSVTSIGNAAFYQCSNLTSVTIPNSVTSIGNQAFYSCSNLTSITIGSSVTSIGDGAFYGCRSLNSITIPNSVINIGKSSFYSCYNLTSIVIGNSVTSIGELAFRYCSGLTSIVIPNSVTNIGRDAFGDCSGLTSISVGNSVTSIGSNAFYGCTALTSISVEKGNKTYDSRNDCNAIIETESNTLLLGCNNTVILNSVLSIGFNAFYGCTDMTKVTIPNSVTSIGGSAFANCSGLISVTMPNSVTSIGASAFSGCSSLTSVTIPNSVTSIGSCAFEKCSSLASITIGNSVESIGGKAFSGCSSLNSITIPNSMTSLDGGRYAGCFQDCYGLISVTIPNSVTNIGNYAFSGCSGLTSITIPESVTSIGDQAFYGCSGLTSVTIPEAMTKIGNEAFLGAKLRNIVIKAKMPPSGGSAFSGQSYYHTTLMVPEGSWDAYAYSNNWYQFINIREMAYNAVNLTNSKAYTMKSATEGAYLFYDSVNDCIGTLNETAFDDTEENNTWMTVEVEGKHYVYNLGAKKFLVADKTGYNLSDVPTSIDIEDGKDAIVFGKGKEFYMVINDKLNVDEGLESQILISTGINEIDVESNLPTVTYNLNGQRINNSNAQKGIYIKNGKKYAK